MANAPLQLTLELSPTKRFDVIDVSKQLADEVGDELQRYKKSLYCSYHTTAGYFDQSLISRLGHRRELVQQFLASFQGLFPPNANYEHDKMHLRQDLDDEQRAVEPRNADSHLTFIGSGLKNCVTYVNREAAPVYFIDLDGVHEHGRRRRKTTVLGYDRETVVDQLELEIPVSGHPIDSIALTNPELGLLERLNELLRQHGISKGAIDIGLDPEERSAGLTVNEYETLLMRHDLAEVLRDPVRFMAQKGKNILRDPLAVPNKTINYAQYDFVRVMNRMMETLGVSESVVERIVARFVAFPASRFLRVKRHINLLVADAAGDGHGTVQQGTYQTPILVQWQKSAQRSRKVQVTLRRFE